MKLMCLKPKDNKISKLIESGQKRLEEDLNIVNIVK